MTASESELREALRVAAISEAALETIVGNMKAHPVEWRRIPRRFRDSLEQLAAGGRLRAASIRKVLE